MFVGQNYRFWMEVSLMWEIRHRYLEISELGGLHLNPGGNLSHL